jgi:type IV pilus assembly protein PilN
MTPKVAVNLASEPFERTRPMLVASAVAAVFLVILLAVLVALSVTERGQAAELRQTIARLEARQRNLNAEQTRLEATLRQPENAEVLARSLFLNSLLYAKGISWTRLFDDLEKVMPYNVRLISIRPQAGGQGEIQLDMVVGAESAEPVVQLLTRLEGSPVFGATLIHNRWPPTQSEPLLRYRVSVSYVQKLPEVAGAGRQIP